MQVVRMQLRRSATKDIKSIWEQLQLQLHSSFPNCCTIAALRAATCGPQRKARFIARILWALLCAHFSISGCLLCYFLTFSLPCFILHRYVWAKCSQTHRRCGPAVCAACLPPLSYYWCSAVSQWLNPITCNMAIAATTLQTDCPRRRPWMAR